MNALAQREARNYQFDFLRPSHSLFNYFTRLVEQYTKVLIPPKYLNEQLKRNVEDKYQVLDRIRDRVEWVAWQEAEKKKREDKEEQERSKLMFLNYVGGLAKSREYISLESNHVLSLQSPTPRSTGMTL